MQSAHADLAALLNPEMHVSESYCSGTVCAALEV